jgi:hypothetical protein
MIQFSNFIFRSNGPFSKKICETTFWQFYLGQMIFFVSMIFRLNGVRFGQMTFLSNGVRPIFFCKMNQNLLPCVISSPTFPYLVVNGAEPLQICTLTSAALHINWFCGFRHIVCVAPFLRSFRASTVS